MDCVLVPRSRGGFAYGVVARVEAGGRACYLRTSVRDTGVERRLGVHALGRLPGLSARDRQVRLVHAGQGASVAVTTQQMNHSADCWELSAPRPPALCMPQDHSADEPLGCEVRSVLLVSQVWCMPSSGRRPKVCLVHAPRHTRGSDHSTEEPLCGCPGPSGLSCLSSLSPSPSAEWPPPAHAPRGGHRDGSAVVNVNGTRVPSP